MISANYTRIMAKRSPESRDHDLTLVIDPDLTMIMDPETGDDHDSDPHPEDTNLEGAGTEPVPSYSLVVHKGQQKGRRWTLSPGVTWVGRHPYSDIPLDHITVSRRHCRLHLDTAGLSIEDLGSTNGCYVNDELVEEATLRAGDRIMIGTFRLIVAGR